MADSNSANEFRLLGFVGHDPKLIACKDPSKKFCTMDVATQERYKGRKDPKVTFHPIQIWGTKMGPWAATAVKKGTMVYVRGKISNRMVTFYDANGNEKKLKMVDLKVEDLMIIRQKKTANEPTEQTPAPAPAQKDPY